MDLRLEHQRVKNKGGPGGINARIKLQRVGVQNKASGRYIRKITFLLTTVKRITFSLIQSITMGALKEKCNKKKRLTLKKKKKPEIFFLFSRMDLLILLRINASYFHVHVPPIQII